MKPTDPSAVAQRRRASVWIPWRVSVLKIDGLTLSYEMYGAGPAIVIPWCNFAWDALDLAPLTRAYTVVVASPRGFGTSERVAAG